MTDATERRADRIGARAERVTFLILCIVVLAFLLSARAGTVVALSPAPQPESAQDAVPLETAGAGALDDGVAGDASSAPTPTGLLEELLPTRTPEPTATSGVIVQEVERLTEVIGIEQASFLGLSAADWINLAISLLFVLLGYLIGTWLIRSVLRRTVQRSVTDFDDRFLDAIGSDVRWLVVLFTLQFATARLTFVSAEVKGFLQDVYFVVGLLLAVRIIIKLIDLGGAWTQERALAEDREGQLEPLILLLTRVGRVMVVILAFTILLSYFGVNIVGFATVLGIGGLAISLAAQDTIADAIAGFIILVDQPFRIGDRIEIQGEGTWGDVVDIGLRTTRIRTRDNRLVIVPNSTISKNQVVNYTFPDPRYRIQTHVGIGYGTDIEIARKLIIDTVRQIDGVLPDKPVDALYVEMGDSAMVFRVRWWIGSYQDTRRMFDRVHTALQNALDEAGIDCPFPTQTLNLQVDPKVAEQVTPQVRD